MRKCRYCGSPISYGVCCNRPNCIDRFDEEIVERFTQPHSTEPEAARVRDDTSEPPS